MLARRRGFSLLNFLRAAQAFSFLMMGFLLSGCSPAEFAIRKDAALSSKGVFDEYQGQLRQPADPGNGIQNTGDATGTINQPNQPGGGMTPGGGTPPGSTPPPGGATPPPGGGNTPTGGNPPGGGGNTPNQTDGTNDEIDLFLMCSDDRSEAKANFKNACEEKLPMELLIGTKICTQDRDQIKALVDKKSFTIADAQKICAPLVPASGKWSNVTLVVNGVPNYAVKGVITLLYALNQDKQPASQAADEKCDKRASPLVVHMQSDPLRPIPIALSSQDDGVLFDLLGDRAWRSPVQISWFTNLDYRFLALPNEEGEVRSIDELFGDNTRGPDGKFADNGYAALAKYDGKSADGLVRVARADGRIDRRDPIFKHLRLWLDRDFDGYGQAHELISLEAAGVEFIDLKYSNDFAESDRYGNLTMMKSVVEFRDGSLDLIFDLWFNYKPPFSGVLR